MKRYLLSGAICATTLLAGPLHAATNNGSETTLYTFTGGADGGEPTQIIAGPGGVYYGIAEYGGSTASQGCNLGVGLPPGCGVVFQLSPPAAQGGAWTQTVLYTFTDGNDGYAPTGIVLGTDGKTIFGTTFGYDNTEGTGTVFQLSPPTSNGGAWIETILHDFRYGPPPPSSTDGVDPESAPIIGKDGTLYGTTLEGGPSYSACPSDNGGCGTVWKISPPYGPSDYSQLYGFKGGTDGSDDPRGVALTASGTLVGANGNGGAYGYGYFYQLTSPAGSAPPGTPWTETDVLDYQSNIPGVGSAPPVNAVYNGIIDSSSSSNTLYYLKPTKRLPWQLYEIVNLPANDAGRYPTGPVIGPKTIDGISAYYYAAFGPTLSPGQGNTCGAIWSTAELSNGGFGSDTTYNFTCGNDGANPIGIVFGPSQSLLGVARNGGANSAGTVFQITDITPP